MRSCERIHISSFCFFAGTPFRSALTPSIRSASLLLALLITPTDFILLTLAVHFALLAAASYARRARPIAQAYFSTTLTLL